MGVLPLTVETLTKRLGVNATTANTVASFGTTAVSYTHLDVYKRQI